MSTPEQPTTPAAPAVPVMSLEKGRVWDKVVENFMLKTAAGAGVGLVTSAILFRNPSMRAATFGFVTGTGFGMAFLENKQTIDAANL